MIGRRRRSVDLHELVDRHLEAGEPVAWFEPLYAAARRDPAMIPWARLAPHPYVSDWLDDPVTTPPGRRAVVVGCGLGDDAALLARRGYEVTAFDVAPTAVAWARRRFRGIDVDWRVVDLLDPPAELVGGFDLVVEVATVPSLPGVVRDVAMDAIARLAAPRGVVLAVTLVATDADVASRWDGPPWAQSPSELATYRGSGLVRVALEHPDPDDDGGMEVRLTWQRPAGAPPPGGSGAGDLPIIA